MRPSSANAKRKDGSAGGEANDFNNANMRQLLAQNPGQNSKEGKIMLNVMANKKL